jgi:hypothetical protein
MAAAQFLFIVVVPLVILVAVLVGLFATGALFDTLDHPGDLRARIEGAFRRPPKEPKAPGADHYYKAYWSKP